MRKKYFIGLAFIFFLLGNAPHAGAFFLEEWVNEFLNPPANTPSSVFSLDSQIVLVQDLNKNNVTDGGDTVRFVYKISNPTGEEFSFLTLQTNLQKKNLHFIHNIKGTASFSDKGGFITIPNLRINPGQTVTVSFDARVNYEPYSDLVISSEPELITSDKKSLYKSSKKQISVKAWKEKIPSLYNSEKKK